MRKKPTGTLGLKNYIACFDVSSSVGICAGLIGTKQPEMQTWKLTTEARPLRLLHLHFLVSEYLRKTRVDRVFVEAPLPIAVMMEIGTRQDTVQMLYGAVSVIELCAARAEVPIAMWRVQDARRAITGYATFPRGTAKTEVAKYAKILGYNPADEHQADALIGFLYKSAE